ncbi:uncharacterized protein LOC134206249 [Armigeres subalbatus]|uniref:uncharacterized protein LOC134206249 n=1 Tax=Armigeres subalbatus TaxID=124917 RepID=UPI002ED33721
MANFVSQRISDLLRLREESVDIPVVGVNGTRSTVKFRVNATVRSRASDCVISLDLLIVPRVTGALPGMQLDTSNWPIPDELQLADPGFFRSSRVDMLIGADVFYELMQAGKIMMSDELPLLQESLLGWLVAGSFNADRGVSSVKICQAEVNDRRDDHLSLLLERFWMIDDKMTEPLNDACERHFRASYTRGKDGRYIVQLPFKEDANRLGNSRDQAEKRFKALEKRLEKCPEVKKMYSDFVNEYRVQSRFGPCKSFGC